MPLSKWAITFFNANCNTFNDHKEILAMDIIVEVEKYIASPKSKITLMNVRFSVFVCLFVCFVCFFFLTKNKQDDGLKCC